MNTSREAPSDLGADGMADLATYDDLELLHSISVELIGEHDIGALYNKILNAAVTIAASQFGSMQFLHSDRGPAGGPGELRLLAAHGYSQETVEAFEWVNARSKTSCGVSLNTGSRTIITDIEKSDLLAGSDELEAFRQAGIRSMQSTPLISRTGRVLGMISTHWTEPHEPSKRDLRMMDILARQAADLMERTRAEAAARETENRFRALATAGAYAMYRMSADWRVMYQLDGRNVLSDTNQPIDNWTDDYILPEDRPLISTAVDKAVASRSLFELEHRVRRADGSVGWIVSRAVPIFGESGEISEWFGVATDVTDKRRTEENYEHLFNSMDDGFCTIEMLFDATGKPADYVFLDINPAFERQTGIANAVGRRMRDIAPAHEQHWFDTYGRVALTGESVRFEHSAKALGRVYDVYAFRIGLPAEYKVGLLFSDITDRTKAAETQHLLLNELNHRVKNTLATVQAIVQMTMRHTKDPAHFAKAFTGRVQSLSRVHSILTDATWQGADLRALIGDQLLSGVMEPRQLQAEGPDVRLPPQMALHLALMLHELGTNAAKYGALRDPAGRVALRWSVADNALKMQWKESGGPRVAAPVRRGFGTTLIESTAKSDGGSAKAVFDADGISWHIELPLPEDFVGTNVAHLPHGDQERGAHVVATEPGGPLAGLRILIVEDEPLVSMDCEAILEGAGATISASAGNVKDALDAVAKGGFDGAILDANLHGKPVDEIAAALTRHGLPFLFVSGHGREGLPKAFTHAPALAKPYRPDDLIAAVGQLRERPQGVAELKVKR